MEGPFFQGRGFPRERLQLLHPVRPAHDRAPMLSGAKVILFGPQARGDAREDSDWDILILLNKDKVELDDHDYISYPFFELG